MEPHGSHHARHFVVVEQVSEWVSADVPLLPRVVDATRQHTPVAHSMRQVRLRVGVHLLVGNFLKNQNNILSLYFHVNSDL